MTAVVTGVTGGIGEATARALLSTGRVVIGTVRKKEQLRQAQERLGPRSFIVALELDSTKSIDESCHAIAGIVDQNKLELQVIVNNAGTVFPGPMAAIPMERLREQFEVNFFGPLRFTRALLPALKRTGGTVINISSVSGRVAMPFIGAYAASKHALVAASDALRMELRGFGVRVVCIHPGNVKTALWSKAGAHAQLVENEASTEWVRPGMGAKLSKIAAQLGEKGSSPEKVARVVLDVVASRKPSPHIHVGADAKIVIPLSRILPTNVLDWLRLKRISEY
jgi:short-subunit dehydrogenase